MKAKLINEEKISNRQKLLNALSHCNKELFAEIMYQLEDVDHGEEDEEEDDYSLNAYDIVDAFEDAADLISSEKDWKHLFKYLKDIYIEIGYAVPVDITKVHVMGGPKYWFIKNGQHYDVEDSWSSWITK